LLRAHEYWRLKLIDVDLVILNEHGATYAQDLSDALQPYIRWRGQRLDKERRGCRVDSR
jgi:cyclic beta-1,2-glucan synthetase